MTGFWQSEKARFRDRAIRLNYIATARSAKPKHFRIFKYLMRRNNDNNYY